MTIQITRVVDKPNGILELTFNIDNTDVTYRISADKVVAVPQTPNQTDDSIVSDFNVQFAITDILSTNITWVSSEPAPLHILHYHKIGSAMWANRTLSSEDNPKSIQILSLDYNTLYELYVEIRKQDGLSTYAKKSGMYTFITPSSTDVRNLATKVKHIELSNYTHSNVTISVYPEVLSEDVRAKFRYRRAGTSMWAEDTLRIPVDVYSGLPIMQNGRYIYYLSVIPSNPGKTYEYQIILDSIESQVYTVKFLDSPFVDEPTVEPTIQTPSMPNVPSTPTSGGPQSTNLPETLIINNNRIISRPPNANLVFMAENVRLSDLFVDYRKIGDVTPSPWLTVSPFQYGQYYAEFRNVANGTYEYRVRTSANVSKVMSFSVSVNFL